jgi:hypothetical protein
MVFLPYNLSFVVSEGSLLLLVSVLLFGLAVVVVHRLFGAKHSGVGI